MQSKKTKYAAYQDTFQGRNSFSKTDPDATFMHMTEDHMRNAQLKPGYNIQFGIEGEYITGVTVSSKRSDQLTLIPFMEKLRSNRIEYEDVTADAGYESEENYSYFEGIPTECYIKPQNHERSKTKKYKSNMTLLENMAYDEALDEYACQAGRKLQVSKKFIAQRAASPERITSEKGILLRMNRSIQLEGAFGVIKQDYNFRQFLLRGNRKVTSEIMLVKSYSNSKNSCKKGCSKIFHFATAPFVLVEMRGIEPLTS